MRISGFATGMDIDSMVKELMAARRAPLNRLTQQKQLIQWQREAYREVSTRLVSFSTDKISNLRSIFNQQSLKADITGSEGVISVSASNSATNLPTTIEVSQVATNASRTATFSNMTRDTLLSNISEMAEEGNSSSITINLSTTEGSQSFVIDFDPTTDTMQSLVRKINTAAGEQLTASFDSASGQLVVRTKATGVNAGEISFSGTLFNSSRANVEPAVEGKNAIYSINGYEQPESASNVIRYDGLTITIKDTGTATIQTKPDTDKLVDAVKSFIEDYNSLIGFMNSKLNEARYRTFLPLTDDQKKELKEDEIKLWNEKAMSGMLRNDDIVRNMVDSMRSAVTSMVNTAQGALNLNTLGLATGKYNEGGKLVLENEGQLRAMIEQDPDKVVNFFTGNQSVTGNDTSTVGIINRLSKIMTTGLDQLAKKAGTSRISSDLTSTLLASSTLGQRDHDLERRIAEMNRKLNIWETTYYKQFTAMESAINRLNSQSSSLMSFMQ